MKNFIEKLSQFGHFKCTEKRNHVSKATMRASGKYVGKPMGNRACNANPHTCNFILDRGRVTTCGLDYGESCESRKSFTYRKLTGWQVSCGVCKRVWELAPHLEADPD